MAGFWHFPFIEVDNFSQEEQFDLFHQVAEESVNFGPSPEESFQQDYDLDVDWLDVCFDTVQHVFSHRKWHVQIVAGQVSDFHDFSDREVRWLSPEEFKNYPLAKPQQKSGRLMHKPT
ncbi:A/G specific adenine glycosylase [Streptococcus pneumoniae 2070335]|nr:A/G specific adenine glycosylase [Streptococcus pneumoniae 2070335]